MYLRPDSLYHTFMVEERQTKTAGTGRVQVSFKPTGRIIRGVLANAKTSEIERWKSLQHPVTHTIVQHYGKIMAKPGDRIVHGSRYFYVQGIDNASILGYFTLYYVEERKDDVG